MKKRLVHCPYILFSIVLAISTTCSLAEDIVVPPDTPFFPSPDVTSKPLFVTNDMTRVETFEKRRFFLEKNPSVKREWHPLMVYTDFHRARLGPDQDAWVSEDLQYDSATNTVVPRPVPQPSQRLPVFATLIVLLAALYYCFRAGHFNALFKSGGILAAKRVVPLLVCVMAARYALLFLTLFLAGNVMVHPTDELGYFQIAKDLLSLDVSGPWNYTVGLAPFYHPFIVCLDAKSFLDIAIPFSYINSLVIAPSCLVLIFLIIQTLTQSSFKAFIVTTLTSLAPFIYFPVELHFPTGGAPMFKSLFAIPDLTCVSYRLYYLFFGVGHDGMSDYPSTLCALLALFLALRMKSHRWMIAVVSALFGFACLIRINNIFFSPLIAYVFWTRMKPELTSVPVLIRRIALASGIFLLFFSPQLIINVLHFQSPFTFPYALHPDGSSQGFLPSVFFSSGSNFLIGCNYMFLALAATGLFFFRKNGRERNVLVFWAFPTILFFCGYPVIGASPIRFILTTYGALWALLVCADFWDEGRPLRRKLSCVGIIAANVILVSPCHRFSPPFPFELEFHDNGKIWVAIVSIAVPILSVIWAALALRDDRRALVFIIAFLALFHAGSPHLILVIICGGLAYCLYRFAADVVVSFRAPPLSAET